MPKTPCHVIAGPLGVGKTTAILSILEQQLACERVGVLVNDFGPIGMDRTRFDAEAPDTEVVNLRGGCICCTLQASLPEAVIKLVSEKQVDRLIIEPSGMASPAQAIDTLRQPELQDKISLQPTVVLLSAVEFDEQLFERMPYYRMLCDVSEVLVFNRCDQVGDAKIERIQAWSESISLAKRRVVLTEHGKLPEKFFDSSMGEANLSMTTGKQDHVHQFDTQAKPGGVVLDAGHVFNEAKLISDLQWLCDHGLSGNDVIRFKGIARTDQGWRSVDIANGSVSKQPSAHREDSRLEWVTDPNAVSPEQVLAAIGYAEQPTELTSPGSTT